VKAPLLLETLFQIDADLRAETIMAGINRCADDGRESRIDQSLQAYDQKDALFAVGREFQASLPEFASLHGKIWYWRVSRASRFKRCA
jgi:hypothetical protein